MAAALLVSAAAIVATATWPPVQGILHGVGQSSPRPHTLPNLTLSHDVPTLFIAHMSRLLPAHTHSTTTTHEPLTSSHGRQVLHLAHAGHPPTTLTTTRPEPAEPSAVVFFHVPHAGG